MSINYGLAVWAREADGSTTNGWLGALVSTWDDAVDGMNTLKGDYQSLSGDDRNQVINANNYRYELVGTADFNGDGKDDVMLWNTMPEIVDGETILGSGDVFSFLTDSHDNVVAGNRPAEGICYAGCATDGWKVVGTADFNGDGTDDALLSDGTNLAGWQISNGQRSENYWFGPLSGWHYVGVGDYDFDGTDDILVSGAENQIAVWTVKNGAITGSIAIA